MEIGQVTDHDDPLPGTTQADAFDTLEKVLTQKHEKLHAHDTPGSVSAFGGFLAGLALKSNSRTKVIQPAEVEEVDDDPLVLADPVGAFGLISVSTAVPQLIGSKYSSTDHPRPVTQSARATYDDHVGELLSRRGDLGLLGDPSSIIPHLEDVYDSDYEIDLRIERTCELTFDNVSVNGYAVDNYGYYYLDGVRVTVTPLSMEHEGNPVRYAGSSHIYMVTLSMGWATEHPTLGDTTTRGLLMNGWHNCDLFISGCDSDTEGSYHFILTRPLRVDLLPGTAITRKRYAFTFLARGLCGPDPSLKHWETGTYFPQLRRDTTIQPGVGAAYRSLGVMHSPASVDQGSRIYSIHGGAQHLATVHPSSGNLTIRKASAIEAGWSSWNSSASWVALVECYLGKDVRQSGAGQKFWATIDQTGEQESALWFSLPHHTGRMEWHKLGHILRAHGGYLDVVFYELKDPVDEQHFVHFEIAWERLSILEVQDPPITHQTLSNPVDGYPTFGFSYGSDIRFATHRAALTDDEASDLATLIEEAIATSLTSDISACVQLVARGRTTPFEFINYVHPVRSHDSADPLDDPIGMVIHTEDSNDD